MFEVRSLDEVQIVFICDKCSYDMRQINDIEVICNNCEYSSLKYWWLDKGMFRYV